MPTPILKTQNMNNQQQLINIKGCANGDINSQKELFNAYSSELLATCKRYMKSEDEAKDVLQDSFIRIFKYAHTFNPDGGNLKGWMKTICIRVALRQLKKQKNLASIEDMQCLPAINPVAIQNLDTEELYNAIQELPEKQRTVFNLYVVEGYSHREIANVLDVAETCSRSILSRTKKILKEKLKHLSFNVGNNYSSLAY